MLIVGVIHVFLITQDVLGRLLYYKIGKENDYKIFLQSPLPPSKGDSFPYAETQDLWTRVPTDTYGPPMVLTTSYGTL